MIGPVVTFQVNPDTMCSWDNAIVLVGSPSGGIFSGPGVDTTMNFNPSTAGVGDKIIFYNYTDSATACVITVQDTIHVDYCMSVPALESGISISPNPVTTTFGINTNYNAPLDIIILNTLGSEVMHCHLETSGGKIDVETLSPGIYFIDARLQDSRVVVPFVKQ